MYRSIQQELRSLANPKKATILARFFKTGKGEYGEGDKFLGIQVPDVRRVARKYTNLSLEDVHVLLRSDIHEERLVSLLVLAEKFKKGNRKEQTAIYSFYLKNAKNVNNWDLVDLSAHRIVGEYLHEKEKLMLYKLARSRNLWERRIAIIATYAFIKKNFFDETMKIAKLLLHDNHNLIQKAVGWMLREVGKRNQQAEEQFLKQCYRQMPRTMLRYAIERFNQKKKEFYMKKVIIIPSTCQ